MFLCSSSLFQDYPWDKWWWVISTRENLCPLVRSLEKNVPHFPILWKRKKNPFFCLKLEMKWQPHLTITENTLKQWRRMVKNVGEAEPQSLSPSVPQSPSPPVPQSPSPSVSQSPSLPASQSPSLSDPQPPSTSVSQSLSLPVPQPPSLSASQPPSLPASIQSPSLPVPQPPSLSASQPPSLPASQPPSLSASLPLIPSTSHSFNAIVLKKIVSKLFPFTTKLSQSWWGSSLMSLNVCAAPALKSVIFGTFFLTMLLRHRW